MKSEPVESAQPESNQTEGAQSESDVEAMAAAFLRIESAAPASREGLSGVVRIGATEGLGTIVLAPRLALFARRHRALALTPAGLAFHRDVTAALGSIAAAAGVIARSA